MVKKGKMFNKLKDKASQIKDAGMEEAKRISKSSGATVNAIKNIQNGAGKKLHKKPGSDTSAVKKTVASKKMAFGKATESKKNIAAVDSQRVTTKRIVKQKVTHQTTDRKILEDLLGTRLPDWAVLKDKAIATTAEKKPVGTTRCMENPLSVKIKHLKKGPNHDIWRGENLLVLKAHPTFIEKILVLIASLFSILLKPWYALKNGVESIIRAVAEKLGAIFFIFALPIAFLAFLGDILTMVLEFIFAIPRLIFSPLTLVRSLIGLIFEFFAKLIARLIWAFLLPNIGRILNHLKSGKIETLQGLLKRRPWMRYLVLGFFRAERPLNPFKVIPAETVSQALITQRGGVFNRGEYLVVVEGETMVDGMMNRFWSWFKMLILPFYWERTVHILCLPKEPNAKKAILDATQAGLGKTPKNWS
ncbi:MAG: hypothetical protein ACT6FE_00920 [Methanosarcinaceae archaeon]